MAIYDFSPVSWMEFTGVDSAMCYRAGILADAGYQVQMVFPTAPYPRDLLLYRSMGLPYEQLTGVPLSFTDFTNYAPQYSLTELLEDLKRTLRYTQRIFKEHEVVLLSQNSLIATVALADQEDRFFAVHYYKGNMMYRSDYYTEGRYLSAFYEIKKTENRSLSAIVKERIYYNRDGSIALMQKKEQFFFPDGRIMNPDQLFELYLCHLHLSERDTIILERPLGVLYTKAVFQKKGKAKVVAVFHSEHWFEKGLSTEGETLNREYWYWARYSSYINTMVVSTQEQKQLLEETLKNYRFAVPEIRVIPVMGIDHLDISLTERKRKAIICAARLNERKKITWVIAAAIRAHEMDPGISLDIYGEGPSRYETRLREQIKTANAGDYIRLMGNCNLAGVYEKYELFLTASLWETFGITLLEAVKAGLPIVGFDVRYGNRIFIEGGKNGAMVPYDPDHFAWEDPPEVHSLAEKIVEILSDEEKRIRFSKHSYEIAGRYYSGIIQQKWITLLN